MGTGYYTCSATSNDMKLVHWPLMVCCYIWYSEEGTGQSRSLLRPLLTVPNVTAYPSTVLLCNGSLLCGFNVPVKGLKLPILSDVIPGHCTCSVVVDREMCAIVCVGRGTFHVQHRLLHSADLSAAVLQTYLTLRHKKCKSICLFCLFPEYL